jgi:hypothetical protein
MQPKSNPDNRFKIKISGNPQAYVPGDVYTGKIFAADAGKTCYSSYSLEAYKQASKYINTRRVQKETELLK